MVLLFLQLLSTRLYLTCACVCEQPEDQQRPLLASLLDELIEAAQTADVRPTALSESLVSSSIIKLRLMAALEISSIHNRPQGERLCVFGSVEHS